MRRKIWFLSLVLPAGLQLGLAADEKIALDQFGLVNMRTQKIAEHPQQDNWLGGLTMAVSENTWPLVFQYPNFAGYPFAEGNGMGENGRNIWSDVQWGYVTPVDLMLEDLEPLHQGAFRPVLVRHVLSKDSVNTIRAKKVVEKDWCHIRYRYEFGSGQGLEAVYSRMAPAFLFNSSSGRLRLFGYNRVSFQLSGRPDKEVGGCNWPRLTRLLMKYIDAHPEEYRPYRVLKNLCPYAAYGGSTIDYVTFSLRPVAMAWAGSGGTAVARGGNAELRGEELHEPWLLVWHGGGSPLMAMTLPCFYARGLNPLAPAYGLHQMDCPFLVVLENRPKRISLDADGLLLEYDGAAGRVVLHPLRGVNFFEVEETESWREAGELPEEIAAQCRAWAGRLLDFPLRVREFAQVGSSGAVVFEESFDYEALQDNWQFARRRLAPVPPMAATAFSFGFPVHFDGQPVETGVFTKFGKYMAFEDVSGYSWRIEGMDKYIGQRMRLREPRTPAELALAEKVRREAERMVSAGHLAPLVTFMMPYLYPSTHWDMPGELVYSMASVADLLSPELKGRVKHYLRQELEAYPPLAGERFPPEEGRRREEYVVPPGQENGLALSESSTLQMFNKPPQIPYQLWCYAEKFDDWDYLAANREELAYFARLHLRSLDWATCFLGTLRCQAPQVGFRLGIHDLNNFIAGAIGYARIAEKFKDAGEAMLARALVAKWLLARFAFARFEESMFREGVARVSAAGGVSEGFLREHILPQLGAAQVYCLSQFGLMLDREGLGYGWAGGRFKNLTPEVSAFLYDFNGESEQNTLKQILAKDPLWYLSGGIFPPPCEKSLDHCLAVAWLLRDPQLLVPLLDAPDALGDLYFFQKAAAAFSDFDVR